MTETTNAADAATAQPTMPPGPSSKLMTTLRIVRDHYKFYEDLYARYEDPVRVPSMNGDVAVTRDPELIRQIFSSAPELFDPFAVDAMRGIVGPGSLLLLGGAAHRAERKLLMPPFHGDRMRAYGEVMRDVALAQLHALQVGAPFIAQRMTTDTSLEVIIRAVFGVMDAGRHTISFDGDDALPAGEYSYDVAVTDDAGEAVAVQTYTTARVTGVSVRWTDTPVVVWNR